MNIQNIANESKIIQCESRSMRIRSRTILAMSSSTHIALATGFKGARFCGVGPQLKWGGRHWPQLRQGKICMAMDKERGKEDEMQEDKMARWQGNSVKGKVGTWNDDDGWSWMHRSGPDQGASYVFISTHRWNSLRLRMQATTQNIGCAECDCSFLSLAWLQAL